MTRTLKVTWAPGEKVTARLAMPADPSGTAVLLAHGAGAPQDHPWMVLARDRFSRAGLATMTFNYAYSEAGRRSPDRLPKLLAVHAAAAERLREYTDRVAFAGKSMGGRVASHLVGDEGAEAAAMIYFGYPLVPMGKGEPRPTDHLERIHAPQLFIAGTRDRLSPPGIIEPLTASLPAATFLAVEEGDHSLRVPKRTGRSSEEVVAETVDRAATWLEGL